MVHQISGHSLLVFKTKFNANLAFTCTFSNGQQRVIPLIYKMMLYCLEVKKKTTLLPTLSTVSGHILILGLLQQLLICKLVI